jgi:outer membrane lipoprotein
MGLISLFLGVVACAPVFAPDVRSQVDPTLSYAELAASPASHAGRVVLLAGTIVEVTNLQDSTRLTLLQYPTGGRGQPRTHRPSGGRFLLLTPGYLEAEVYRPGRALSVIGEVEGQQALPLGETTYGYPVITPKELHLWPADEGQSPRFYFSFGAGFSKGF